MSKNTGTSELINYFDLGVNGDVGIAGSLDINTIANATTDTDKFLVSDSGVIKYRTGAELLSDIGGQGLLTNPVTGTGTTNYLPKFTSASTIGNSAIFENGTNVGINTASPSSYTNLTTVTINGTNGSVIDLKTGNTLYGEIYSLANELRIDAVGGSSVLKFLTNSVTRLTIASTGNVGIGVTPSTILTINGGSGAYPTLGTATANALMIGRSDKLVAMFLGYAADGNGWIQQMRTDSATAYNLVLQPSGGNLLVGTTTDAGYKLDVNGTTLFRGASVVRSAGGYSTGLIIENTNTSANNFSVLTLKANTDGYPIIEFKEGDNQKWQIFNNYSDDSLNFYKWVGTAGTVLSLASTGAATFSSSVTAVNIIARRDSTTSGTDAQFISENRTGTSGQYAIYGSRLDNGSGAGFVPVVFGAIQTSGAGRTGDFIIAVSNTDNVNLSTHERMRITSGGNVGIGTESPSNKLEIRSKNAGDNLNLLGLVAEAAATGGSTASLVISAVPNQIKLTTGTSDSIAFETDGANQRMAISSNGYVRLSSSSGGIQFNGDTAAANALDDYEEGTWTPTIRGAVTAGTYELSSFCSYTKIGRQVTANGFIVLASSVTGGGTTYAQITGLPFAKASNTFSSGTVAVSGIDFTGTYLTCEFVSVGSTSIIYIYEVVDGGSGIDLPVSAIGANDVIKFTITYFT